MIGVDTSFLMDFLKGEEKAVKAMEKYKDSIYICENVVYEFLCGNLSENDINKFLGFVSQFPVVGFGRDAAIVSSKIFRDSKKKGDPVPHPDAMVAGSYLAENIDRIITRNKSHFEKIKGLKVLGY